MKVVKVAVSALLIAAAFLFARAYAYRPYECNIVLKSARSRALMAFDSAGTYSAIRMGRETAVNAEACLAETPEMIDLAMVAALGRRISGERDEAIALYERALQYDHRPELYLQIGLTKLEQGHEAAAREPLRRAIAFDHTIREDVPEPYRTRLNL